MSELRKDPITGRWVVLAPERGLRPGPSEKIDQTIPRPSFCPFCEGNEEKTPPEVFSLRQEGTAPDTKGWRVRVVDNKFPALRREGSLSPKGDGLYDRMRGIGAHEVMIEGPQHLTRITQLPVDFIPDILEVYRQRLITLSRDARFRYGLIFKNSGEIAGASLDHNHSQVIATPVIPQSITQEMAGARRFHDYRGRCIYCDIINQELEYNKRVINEGRDFVVLAPYASRFPFETWILPKAHRANFTTISTSEISELATMLYQVLRRLDQVLGAPPFNYVIHTAPFSEGEVPHYHWHIEILPRVERLAGFEFGTGFHINAVAPEDAAETMRRIEL